MMRETEHDAWLERGNPCDAPGIDAAIEAARLDAEGDPQIIAALEVIEARIAAIADEHGIEPGDIALDVMAELSISQPTPQPEAQP